MNISKLLFNTEMQTTGRLIHEPSVMVESNKFKGPNIELN